MIKKILSKILDFVFVILFSLIIAYTVTALLEGVESLFGIGTGPQVQIHQ